MPQGIIVVLSNAVAGREDEFNEWYDTHHVPHVLSVEGVVGATRAKFSDVEILDGGKFDDYRYG